MGRAEDPHDLVAWVNEIEHMPARREEDPHDLASWVNEIEHTDLASASFPISPSTEASSVGRPADQKQELVLACNGAKVVFTERAHIEPVFPYTPGTHSLRNAILKCATNVSG